MNILIVGYGKMGKSIEEIALNKGHNIVDRIDLDNQSSLKSYDSGKADVAIEFSQPDAAWDNIRTCLENGIKVVSGTTGWLKGKAEVEKLCREKKGTFFYASNYSIGVNLFFRLNSRLAEMMNSQAGYNAEITEIHHTEKKDAPSGTAITLAEGILNHMDKYKSWVNTLETETGELGIISKREGKVPGTHIVKYKSGLDEIEIKHEAYSRKGFAMGAVMVAEWIENRNGILGMDDFLKI